MFSKFFWVFFLILSIVPYVSGCITSSSQSRPPSQSLTDEKGLVQRKLAFYNDSFETLREDLWDKAGFIRQKAQLANFKLAAMRIENGQLIVETRAGCFSKGGLGSKFSLRGDFDIQVDCSIDFLSGKYDMDQIVDFVVFDKSKELKKYDGLVSIGLRKIGSGDSRSINSIYCELGKCQIRNSHKIHNFHGSLRMTRKGYKIRTRYRSERMSEWKNLSNFRSTTNDVLVGFKLQNFHNNRTSITARSPIIAIFDNFKINAAQAIIEEEI